MDASGPCQPLFVQQTTIPASSFARQALASTGSVTQQFASCSEANWNESTLTYTDGSNSIKVAGVAAQFATLTSMGAFFDATTERIFKDSVVFSSHI